MTVQQLLARLTNSPEPPPFPLSFFFGVATADHQCEAYDPNREDIRDTWERDHKQVGRGRATDFGHRFAEDVELARQLGCTAFRFSIAWSRVEPAPGQFDEDEFDHYRQVIKAIRDAGMEPIVTLHHFTWPLHIEQQGGMIAPRFPELFGRYVNEVVNCFGQDVRYWVTFNEPTQLVYGYIKPWWVHDYYVPPGLPPGATLDDQTAAMRQLMRNLFIAHTQARQIIKANNPNAQVGTNPLLLGFPVWLRRIIDWNATRIHDESHLRHQVQRFAVQRAHPSIMQEPDPLRRLLRHILDPLLKIYSVLSTMIASDWWHLGMAGKLPAFLCPRECVGQQDFVGLDYYWGMRTLQLNRIQALLEAGMGRYDKAPVWPNALYDHLKEHSRQFPDLPIIIMENGSVEVADGIDRATYLCKHIEQVQKACGDGMDIAGYICWSITSNREWGAPFAKSNDFGLYHIELDADPELKRVRTPSASTYKEIIAERQVPEALR